MPTLSKEQIVEMEMTLGDLLDQLEDALIRADRAEKRADAAENRLRQLRSAYPEMA